MKTLAIALAAWIFPASLGAQEIPPVITVRADHVLTLKAPTVLCDASRGTVTFTLPQPEARRSFSFTVKKIDASPNACRFGARIDRGLMPPMQNQYEAQTVVSDANGWWAR